MKPAAPAAEKDFGQDLKIFEQLPAKVRELQLLKDQAEKATGPEGVALDKHIRDKSTRGVSA